ncbi:hypothetical protein ATX04_10745, partial [Oenococcus oeni]
MAEKKVMLVCAAGMSTSLLVSKMQKAAKEQGEDVDIFATAASDADNKLESEQPDILMLGPQVSYMLSQFKEKVKIPVEVINMQDYGLMNGEKVLNQALKEIGYPKITGSSILNKP